MRYLLLLSLSVSVTAHAETLTFEQTMTLVAQSPAVRSAAQNAELERRGRNVARSPVRLSLGSGVRGSSGFGGPDETEAGVTFDPVTLAATLNVVPVGPNATAAERADAGVRLAETATTDALQDTLLSAAEQHLSALRNADRTAVLQAQIETARFALAGVQARLRAGAAGEDELLAAQLALAGAESDLATALRQGAEILGTLALTLGVDVSGVRGPVPAGAALGPYNLGARLERRSDVQEATAAVREAERAAADARFGTLPTGTLGVGYSGSAGGQNVTLGAAIGSESGFQPSLSASYQPFGDAINDSAPRSGFSASLSVSITLDPATPTVLETAALRVAQARADLGNVRALARLEVLSREREHAAASASLELAARQLELGNRLLAGVQARFELGLVAPLELKQAQGAQLEAQGARDMAQDAVLLARLRLARALAIELENVL